MARRGVSRTLPVDRNWSFFSDYVTFIGALVIVMSILTLAFGGYSEYVEALGTVSLGTEACLAMPQLYRNQVNKSTAGMRCVLWSSSAWL